ncbi:hypothetical protein AM1_A0106 (plasmid) [Acaryochloris marina MBIC11017]|uniref:Uncharacterized protein n=1 Tax=Acaryochloris marina (strain MBIC 11017) TaxID=329726 RepID=A8ZKB5_ACAM1|nr:hypothetical protein AM1_A0106 [Acaryochloris marina MBIC11017]
MATQHYSRNLAKKFSTENFRTKAHEVASVGAKQLPTQFLAVPIGGSSLARE